MESHRSDAPVIRPLWLFMVAGIGLAGLFFLVAYLLAREVLKWRG